VLQMWCADQVQPAIDAWLTMSALVFCRAASWPAGEIVATCTQEHEVYA
jgi:hypothetical protein